MIPGLRTVIYPTPDLAAAAAWYARIVGALPLEPIAEVGGGVRVAAVQDPFGNRFGLVNNPHFDPTTVH